MEEAALVAAVEDRTATALADLGRPSVLVALCDGEPTTEAIVRAAWASERAAADTFETWVTTATTDIARTTYEAVAAQERSHVDQVAALLDDIPESTMAPGLLHGYLRGLESPVARAGAGLVGRPLASLRTYDRIRRYAGAVDDPALATCVAALRADTRETVTAGVELLDTPAVADPLKPAIDAAVYAIELIHDDHADALVRDGRGFR